MIPQIRVQHSEASELVASITELGYNSTPNRMLDGAQKVGANELVKPVWLAYTIERMERRCVDGLEIVIQPRTFRC